MSDNTDYEDMERDVKDVRLWYAEKEKSGKRRTQMMHFMLKYLHVI